MFNVATHYVLLRSEIVC